MTAANMAHGCFAMGGRSRFRQATGAGKSCARAMRSTWDALACGSSGSLGHDLGVIDDGDESHASQNVANQRGHDVRPDDLMPGGGAAPREVHHLDGAGYDV